MVNSVSVPFSCSKVSNAALKSIEVNFQSDRGGLTKAAENALHGHNSERVKSGPLVA